jgi:lipoate-protein ligase A
MLRCIQRQETDPYFNLAAEEFLLKSATQDIFMTWRNEPSLVIGKHQNTFREINHSFVEKYALPVIRRISGGGTVYHDPGNLNFSFIYTQRKENLIDFREFTLPIILFLQNLGLNAAFEGKNNITVDGYKVSGNSAHIFKNNVLHHGTLLFNTDLEKLELAISDQSGSYKDKAVNSVRANVANISDFLPEELTLAEFISLLRHFIFSYFKNAYDDGLQPAEIHTIHKLSEEKYRSYKWNFGYSPEYEYNRRWSYHENDYKVRLSVKDGFIQWIEIQGPETRSVFFDGISEVLTGVRHQKKSISARLKNLTFANEMELEIMNQIMNHLF